MKQVPGNGLLVVDASNNVVFSSGIAGDEAVKAALIRHQPAIEQRGMDVLTIRNRRFAFVFQNSDGIRAYIVNELSDESALFNFVGSIDFAYSIFNHFVCSPFEAMAVVDADARLRYLSPVHAKSLGLEQGEGIGRLVTDVIRNTRLHTVVKTGKADIGQLMDINGKSRIVNRVPIFKDGRLAGAIGQMMFKAPEQLHELSHEVSRLRSEVNFYQRELSVMRSRSYGLEQIVGDSEAMRELKSQIVRIAPLDVPVMLLGESGTGKELVAHAIHNLSSRKDKPMVAINAAAMPATLVESEMFGYEGGAFTGAERKGRKGKFELADRSTLFLDEIGDMPPDVQIKLLRVLQDGMFERIGSERPRNSDFRLITATNRDIKDQLDTNKFRLDLYYRISSVTLRLPALRERLDDIPMLVDNFLQAYSRRHQTRLKHVHRDVCPYLRELPWPGNVRQLLHEVEKAAIFCDSDEISARDFGRIVENMPAAHMEAQRAPATNAAPTTIESMEISLIREALVRHRGNKTRVATELGISRSYLYKKLAVAAQPAEKVEYR